MKNRGTLGVTPYPRARGHRPTIFHKRPLISPMQPAFFPPSSYVPVPTDGRRCGDTGCETGFEGDVVVDECPYQAVTMDTAALEDE